MRKKKNDFIHIVETTKQIITVLNKENELKRILDKRTEKNANIAFFVNMKHFKLN